ncbi:hypothetical protein SLE2022_319710 [Rubroshorea leprosula]
MAHSVVESTEKLWDTWNVITLVILSLLLQFFLCLFAPLRKQRGGKWVVIIWLAYLLADWVPTFTIGLILQAESSTILVFWATFLLLHLGGPDQITSFSLEDNELRVRYALGYMFQLALTLYLFMRLLTDQKGQETPGLPIFVVLFVGVAKCGERIYAFYQASFDRYGEHPHYLFRGKIEATNDESERSCNYTLGEELSPYGTIKSLLVGPLLSPGRRKRMRAAFLRKGSTDILLMLEIELSLLYEVLHTKLPLPGPIPSWRCGLILYRFLCLVLLWTALTTFSPSAEDYVLGMFELWLTYGLLIGAITMDIISIGFLILSDCKFLSIPPGNLSVGEVKATTWKLKCGKGRRWSKTIPQCNFITNNVYPKPSNYVTSIQTILKAIGVFQCLSSQNLREDREWRFIFEEVRKKALQAETVEMGKKICLKRGDGILDTHEEYRHLRWSIKELDYTKSLLTWHIATEVCFQNGDQRPASFIMDYRGISKLVSDYIFYLLQMEPAMMATVSTDWRDVRREACRDLEYFCRTQSVADKIDLSRAIFAEGPESPSVRRLGEKSVLVYANKLADQLKRGPNGLPWELMSQVWVEIMCYAAINCRPNVHAQQPSKGGQLLTFVWLLMNHFGLGTQFETDKRAVDDDEETSV